MASSCTPPQSKSHREQPTSRPMRRNGAQTSYFRWGAGWSRAMATRRASSCWGVNSENAGNGPSLGRPIMDVRSAVARTGLVRNISIVLAFILKLVFDLGFLCFDLRVSGGRVQMKMFYDLIFTNLEWKWAVFMHIYIWLFWGLPLFFASTVFRWWKEMPLWPSQFFVQIKKIWFHFVANVNFKAPIIICCIKNSLLLYMFNIELKDMLSLEIHVLRSRTMASIMDGALSENSETTHHLIDLVYNFLVERSWSNTSSGCKN